MSTPKARPFTILPLGIILVMILSGTLALVAGADPSRLDPLSGETEGTIMPPLPHGEVTIDVDGFAGWAVLNRASGEIAGENLDITSSPQSMIKPWLVGDYLHRSSQNPPELLAEASAAIRVSDDEAAQAIYERAGSDESIRRLISTCELTDTEVYPGWWSKTMMSVRDTARMGECVADGRAAGGWTDWLLSEMRNVEGGTSARDQHESSGGGRWGIIDGLPETLRSEVSIKNGWTRMADGSWDVNCMAVHSDWVLTVMMGYPNDYSLDYGAKRCGEVARQLFDSYEE